MAAKRFRDDQRYLVQGSTLNEIFNELATVRLLKGPGYDLNVVPGGGTTLKIDTAIAGLIPWDIEASGDAFHLANPGKIYTSASDTEAVAAIVDLNEDFDFGPGDLVYIELTFDPEDDTPELTLISGDPPDDFPLLYEFAEPPSPIQVTRAIFPLWEGIDGEMPEEGEIGKVFGDWWARQYPRSLALRLIWEGYDYDDDIHHIAAPVLVPY